MVFFCSVFFGVCVLFGDLLKIVRRSQFSDRIEENNKYKKHLIIQSINQWVPLHLRVLQLVPLHLFSSQTMSQT